MKIGYARTSTLDQHLDLQLDALKNCGCEKIFQEQVSSVKDKRPQLESCLQALRAGPHCQNSCHPHLNNPNGEKGDNHGTIQCRTQTGYTKQTFIT